MLLQNPSAPQANDGTRGKLEILIEFDFIGSLKVLRFVRSLYAYLTCLITCTFICYLLRGRISPVRALCIIFSVYVCF